MTVQDAHKLSVLEEARNRVKRLEGEASRVSDELRRERAEVAALSPSKHTLPDPLPTRLNVGCGYDIRPHFLNVDNGDWHSPDLVADITDLFMLPSGHFEEIVAQDVLEHIERGKQVSTLREWGRLLSPNGVLRVRVPSLTDMAALAKLPDWQNEERQTYLINMVYGTQAYPGDYHLCGYTPWTVIPHAREAGLIVAEAKLKDMWLYDLTFRPAAAFDRLSSEEYVHWAYFTELHRVADPSGVSYWVSQLDAGKSREEVLEGMNFCVGNF
jgi:SAM-dependent methyltransferase